VANLPAKFEVSSFNRSRNMEGTKILKVDYVTPWVNPNPNPNPNPFALILHF